jgi:plastocyanin
MIRSVDDLFTTSIASFAFMDFYEPEFSYGVYEYVDTLNESLTGKIIVAQPLTSYQFTDLGTGPYNIEPIKITRHAADTACAINNSCYEPFAVSVDVRDEVIWKNIDSFSHSVTSGTPEDGPDGAFDSGLIPPMRYFSHTFSHTFSAAGAEDNSSWQGEGIYEYYCTFHPWMQGMVIVGEI